jgi:chromosomal replication initiation ATPase DnaA
VITELTPTQRQIFERRKAFHAAIAAKATDRAQAQEPPAPKPKFEQPMIWPVLPEVDPLIERPIARIQRIVAKDFGVKVKDLLSDRRTADVVVPRHIAMFLAKELTPHTFYEIGRRFRRDHTSVLHAVRKVTAHTKSDPKLHATVERIRQDLK